MDVEADDAAFLVIGPVQGLVLRWSFSGRGFELVVEVERLLDVLLGGFKVPGDRKAVADRPGAIESRDYPARPDRSKEAWMTQVNAGALRFVQNPAAVRSR